MRKKNLLILILAVLFLNSCGLFDSGGETIKGKYNIIWIDTHENRSINYANADGELGGEQKVGAFIKKLGFNDRFIVAQRIYFDVFIQMEAPDYDSISYFIIDLSKSSAGDEDVLGPFDEIEFNSKKQELGISNLAFTKEYFE